MTKFLEIFINGGSNDLRLYDNFTFVLCFSWLPPITGSPPQHLLLSLAKDGTEGKDDI